MIPTNEELEDAYVADVVRRTERAFHPRDKEEKKLYERFSKDFAADIDPRNSASYEQMEQYRREKAQKPRRKISVSISLLIERDGSVHDIEVVDSSEYDFVNEAALAAPRKAARYRPVPVQLDCPFKVYVKLYCNVVDTSISVPSKQAKRGIKPPPNPLKLAEIVDRFGGWQKLMSPDFEITEEILTAIELEAFMDRKTFLSMKTMELLGPRKKELRSAASDLCSGWYAYKRRLSPPLGDPIKEQEVWEIVLRNFWHLHGSKMDELGISIEDVVSEIEKSAKSFPTISTEMFTALTQIRRPRDDGKI